MFKPDIQQKTPPQDGVSLSLPEAQYVLRPECGVIRVMQGPNLTDPPFSATLKGVKWEDEDGDL